MAEGTSLGTAWLDVVPSFKGLKRKISEEFGSSDVTGALTGATESWGSRIGSALSTHIGGALASIGKIGLGGVSAAVGGVTAALTAQIPAAIAASDATEKFRSTLEFAGVDPSRIKALTAAAQRYADQTVYDLSDIQSVTAQLAANNVKDFDRMAEAAGNVNAVAGGTRETFKQVALALVQINGAGKLTTQDWNQIAAAIPGASGKLQEAMRANAAFTGNFRDAMARGEITAEEFNKAMMDLGFTDVAEQAAKSATTFEGAWGNLEAAVEKGLVTSLDKVKEPLTDIVNAVGEQLGPAFDTAGKYVDFLAGKLRPFADAMKDGKLTLEDIGKSLATAAGGFAALAGAGTLLADPSLITGFFDALPSPSVLAEKFAGLGGAVKDGAGKIIGPALESFGSIGPKMGEALSSAAGPLGSAAEGLLSRVGMFLNPARFGKVLAFGGIITAAVAGLGALVQASGGELTTQIQSVISNVILEVSKVSGELVKQAPQLIASGAEALKMIVQGITTALPVVLNAAGQIIEAFIDSFGDWLPQLIPAAAQMIVALVQGLVAMLPQLISAGVDLIHGLVGGITAAIPIIVAALPGVIGSLLNALAVAVPQLIEAGMSMLLGLIDGLVAALPTLAQMIPQIITTVVTTLVTALPQLIEAGVQVLQALISGLMTAIPLLIDMLPTIIQTVVGTITENLPMIIEAGLTLLMTLIDGILQALPMLIDMLPTIIQTVVITLVTNLPLIIEAGIQLLLGLINGLVKAIPQLIEMLPQIITTIVTVLVQNLPLIIGAGVQILTGLIGGIIQALPALTTLMVDIPVQMVKALASAPGTMFTSGRKIIQGLIDGVKSMVSAVTGTFSDLLGRVRQYLPFSPAKRGPFSGKGWTLYSGQSIVEALAQGAMDRAPMFEAAIRDTIESGQEQLASLESGALSVTAGLGGTAGLAGLQAAGPSYLVVRDIDDKLVGRMRVEASGVVSSSLAPTSRGAMRSLIGF